MSIPRWRKTEERVAPEDLKEKVLDANRRFHEELVSSGSYADQPFLNDNNRARVRRIVEKLAREAGNEALLDIGCGTGFILGIAHGCFQRLAGIDISRKLLDQISIPSIDLRVAQVENIPFPDGSFNVIIMHGVLHHLYEMGTPFKEICRCLKPGGILYSDESPNAYCMRALRGMDLSDPRFSKLLREAAVSVQQDVEVYEKKYKLQPEVVRMAMYRDKVLGGIKEEEVREALLEAGFSTIDYQYRWFLGQGKYFGTGFDEESCRVEEYLRSLLPLTRSVFKYISFTARKG